ncbi:MAG: mandelate racemase [Opitutae bacterium]|nr:mandelate racemase [Opitutae bacterium]
MPHNFISEITTSVRQFPLEEGDGTDAIHTDPVYSYVVTHIHTEKSISGSGIVFTIGAGNEEICSLIEGLASPLIGREIEELMSQFGEVFRHLADHPRYRWLGPHKGMIHLALASITNACYDLWAKARDVPLWKLLIDLTPEEVINTLDLSYLEEELTREQAIGILSDNQSGRAKRSGILDAGYPGYDTSIGWFNYSDDQVKAKVRKAVESGFDAMKLKVGSPETERDIRRAYLVREAAGDDARVMLDVNQSWSLPQSIQRAKALSGMSPFWIEEPTQPDDVLGHQTLAKEIAPIDIALGEHVSNRVLFKNFMQANAVRYVQVDCTRVGGISEFITVSLLARKFKLPVVPHVGDMGQIHQHLVLFNHIALGHEALFLEHIPHLRNYFSHPAQVSKGTYATPQEPGSSSDFIEDTT